MVVLLVVVVVLLVVVVALLVVVVALLVVVVALLVVVVVLLVVVVALLVVVVVVVLLVVVVALLVVVTSSLWRLVAVVKGVQDWCGFTRGWSKRSPLERPFISKCGLHVMSVMCVLLCCHGRPKQTLGERHFKLSYGHANTSTPHIFFAVPKRIISSPSLFSFLFHGEGKAIGQQKQCSR